MCGTLETSLNSILRQIDDRFEVIVVDGGSTDGSFELLNRMETENDLLRAITLPPDKKRKLGFDRHLSIKEAEGKYVLTHIDCDDRYDDYLIPFCEVFQSLHNKLGRDLAWTGSHITMAPRNHVLQAGSYRNLRVYEDVDLWLRLMAAGEYVNLECRSFNKTIRESRSFRRRLKRQFRRRISETRMGLDIRDRISYLFSESNTKGLISSLLLYPIAYLFARNEGGYTLPEEFNRISRFAEERERTNYTLEEIENVYEVSISLENVTGDAQKLFSCADTS